MNPFARELPTTIDLPLSLLREIGKVIVRHAVVELKLNRMIYNLLEIDPVAGRITVREPPTTDRLDMIKDLLKVKKIAVKSNLKSIHKRLKECAAERNRIAHGIWIKDPKHPGILFLRTLSGDWVPPGSREKSKRRIDPEAIEYSVEDAKDLVTFIEETGQAVYDLGDEIDAALAASSKKSS